MLTELIKSKIGYSTEDLAYKKELEETIKSNDFSVSDNFLKDYNTVVTNDPFYKYSLEGYNTFGIENVITNDRGMMKDAYKKLRINLSIFNKDIRAMNYIDVLSSIDKDLLSRTSLNAFLELKNVKAIDEYLTFMYEFGSHPEMNNLKHVSKEIYKKNVKILKWMYSGAYIIGGIVGLLVILKQYANLRELGRESAELLGDEDLAIVQSISKALSDTTICKSLGIKPDNTGVLSVDSVMKLTSRLATLRLNILPTRMKTLITPDFLKDKRPISNEDMNEILDIIQAKFHIWNKTLAGTTKELMVGSHFILKSQEVLDVMDYSVDFQLNTIETQYYKLITLIQLSYVDVARSLVYLVKDVRQM